MDNLWWSLAAVPAYFVLRKVYDDVYERVKILQDDRLLLKARQQQIALTSVRILPPDENGLQGVSFDGRTYRSLDTRATFTQLDNLYVEPILDRVNALQKMLIAARGTNQGQRIEPLMQQIEMPPELPQRVPLTSLLDAPPSYRSLVLGIALGSDGQNEIIKADMAELVHVAVGGSTGWGKSVFLRAIAYQLARSTAPVDLAMVDLEGATLAPFSNCNRLLWPVADTERDAISVFKELTDELNRRRELFAQYPGIDSLYLYNEQIVEEDKLPPIAVIIDEATALLENKEAEIHLKTLSLRARKYGIWLWMGGQDWKATSLDTAIRNMLASRIQFRTMSGGQSRILLERSGAEDLRVKGRALAWLPGRDFVEFQAPIITHSDILAAMRGGGPQNGMPETKQDEKDKIVELNGQGLSRRQIAIAVYGYDGGAAHRKVREVLLQSEDSATAEK